MHLFTSFKWKVETWCDRLTQPLWQSKSVSRSEWNTRNFPHQITLERRDTEQRALGGGGKESLHDCSSSDTQAHHNSNQQQSLARNNVYENVTKNKQEIFSTIIIIVVMPLLVSLSTKPTLIRAIRHNGSLKLCDMSVIVRSGQSLTSHIDVCCSSHVSSCQYN